MAGKLIWELFLSLSHLITNICLIYYTPIAPGIGLKPISSRPAWALNLLSYPGEHN